MDVIKRTETNDEEEWEKIYQENKIKQWTLWGYRRQVKNNVGKNERWWGKKWNT